MSQAQTDPADDEQSTRSPDALQSDESVGAFPPTSRTPSSRTPSSRKSPRADVYRRPRRERSFGPHRRHSVKSVVLTRRIGALAGRFGG
jgi:hypothetical protein